MAPPPSDSDSPNVTLPQALTGLEGDAIVSWNIGLRGLRQLVASDRGADKTAAKDQHGVSRQLGYGCIDSLLDSLGSDVDVVALQECKLTSRSDLSPEIACPSGWDSYHAVCGDASGGAIPTTSRGRSKTGYAGVATYVRIGKRVVAAEEGVTGALTPPERIARGDAVGHYGRMSEAFDRARMLELDSEGRCVLVDLGAFVLFNVYVPSLSSDDEDRERFKLDFLVAVEIRYRALLDAGRRVVLCGDWNVSYGVIDSAVAIEERLMDEALCEQNQSRRWLRRQVSGGEGAKGAERDPLVDVFRREYPAARGAYTCWNVSAGAQLTNYGSRIDYFLCDEVTAASVARCGIAPKHEGSDHAPVFIVIRRGSDCSLKDTGNEGNGVNPLASSACVAAAGRQARLTDSFFKASAGAPNDIWGSAETVGGVVHGMANATGGDRGSLARSQPALAGVKRKHEGGGAGGAASIKSFFGPKDVGKKPTSAASADTNPPPDVPIDLGTRDVPAQVPAQELTSAPTASIETVAAWKAIQKRMAPPKCRGHGLPCKVRTVKEGTNKGRGFFCCPKPKGMKGDKNADCGFFQWEKVYRK